MKYLIQCDDCGRCFHAQCVAVDSTECEKRLRKVTCNADTVFFYVVCAGEKKILL